MGVISGNPLRSDVFFWYFSGAIRTNMFRKFRRLFYTCFSMLIFLFGGALKAQSDYSWWNQQQNWNGITSWVDYMIMSPYYMGPNALPVPFQEKGKVGSEAYLRIYSDSYHQPGGNTQDLGGRLYIPFYKNVVALEMWGIIQEHYTMSEALAVEDRARHQHPEGFAAGDVYFATVIALPLPKHFPEMALRIGLRTASGNHLYDARYTDTPGYFFDLSAGKDLRINLHSFIRIYGMFGFYSWQTNLSSYHQDDAELYGIGMDYTFGKNTIGTRLAGYHGYVGNHALVIINQQKPVPFNDRPVVLRLEYTHKWRWFQAGLRYQDGLNDFQSQGWRLWMSYAFPAIKINRDGG